MWLQNLVGQILLALLALVFILLVLRPAIKNLVGIKGVVEPSVPTAVVAGSGTASNNLKNTEENEKAVDGGIESIKAKLQNPAKSSVSPEMLDMANSYDDKAALMRMLVKEDSKRVAGVILNWVKPEL